MGGHESPGSPTGRPQREAPWRAGRRMKQQLGGKVLGSLTRAQACALSTAPAEMLRISWALRWDVQALSGFHRQHKSPSPKWGREMTSDSSRHWPVTHIPPSTFHKRRTKPRPLNSKPNFLVQKWDVYFKLKNIQSEQLKIPLHCQESPFWHLQQGNIMYVFSPNLMAWEVERILYFLGFFSPKFIKNQAFYKVLPL